MPTIAADSRQIPRKKEITAQSNYNDLIYGWFQANSEWDQVQGHCRWVAKSKVKYSAMEKEIGICRQTISTKVKNLMKMGLLTYNEELKRYELVLLEKDAAMLIEKHTLELLVAAMNQCAITTYVYLYSRYYANQCKPFDFQMEQLKVMCGMSPDNRSNTKFVNILEVLQKLGLLQYTYITSGTEAHEIKSNYRITWMTNRLE